MTTPVKQRPCREMEIPVEAPVSGTVQQVLVQPEEQVEEDQLLVVIDAES